MLNVINAILGGFLLLAGRKLFWLFVGAIGFLIGVQLATRFFHGSQWSTLLIGLAFGAIFAVLAILVESLAIGLAGFLGGGYILLSLASMFSLDKGLAAWLIFIAGGIVGAALVAALFDWALIIISSLAGSFMIVNAFPLTKSMTALAFIALLLVGIAIQASTLGTDQRHEH